LIYSVDFLEQGRMVGCREQELQAAGDPWVATQFEFRDRVTARMELAIAGEIIARCGEPGEIEKVLADDPGGPAYHVRIRGRTLLVPESALAMADSDGGDG
jgi:nitrogen fixation protein NifZ